MEETLYEYFFSMAKKAATRSTCLRRKVGAIAITPGEFIIGAGYNAPLAQMPKCTPDTCYRTAHQIPSGQQLDKCYAIHAEQMLVARLGNKLKDCTVFVTHQPCTTCFKLLISAGVAQIRWLEQYQDAFARELLLATGCTEVNVWTKEEDMPF